MFVNTQPRDAGTHSATANYQFIVLKKANNYFINNTAGYTPGSSITFHDNAYITIAIILSAREQLRFITS